MPKSGLGRKQKSERDRGRDKARSQMSPVLVFLCGWNDSPGQQQLRGGRLLVLLWPPKVGKSGRQECEVADPVFSEAGKAEGWHSAGFLCPRRS